VRDIERKGEINREREIEIEWKSGREKRKR
jgi:hypothetical protein